VGLVDLKAERRGGSSSGTAARSVISRLPRVPRLTVLDATAGMLLALLVMYAPNEPLRVLAALAGLGVAYLAGRSEGRRDLSIDLLRLGRDDRVARRTVPSGPAPEERQPPDA
jgi:hypothetical protein